MTVMEAIEGCNSLQELALPPDSWRGAMEAVAAGAVDHDEIEPLCLSKMGELADEAVLVAGKLDAARAVFGEHPEDFTDFHAAVDRVVDYLRDDERRDFLSCKDDDKANHIFTFVQVLERWLENQR